MYGVRMLRPCQFLGEMRSPGDVITSEELEGVSAGAIDANKNLGNLEVLNGPSGNASSHADARIDQLMEVVTSLSAEVAELKAKAYEPRRRGRPPKTKEPE